ncbi:DoxX family protein [Myceligenerans pegani]|uniref:DoxX family protein n=1 Tax=Myceligenerans pegani TaxID=2776917 RepID=A0ABR9MVZ3_9MICO|nr:DoxX family protein [Myceligenerans sp. TRM 65318]MBE1875551.1 DoxX family protein [Myceligenerans sp. TRM 65318]MBE3017822.1 DoxX family protein [Myceligenerans sp. TRM 65318]
MTTTATTPTAPPRALDVTLWIAQGLLALMLIGSGLFKLLTPLAQLAETFPWAGDVAPGVVYAAAAFDILGGLGVLLPSLTRIAPQLTVLAALGCVALLATAAVFHFSRGEGADTPINFVLIALALFVAWGRRSRAPIRARSQAA